MLSDSQIAGEAMMRRLMILVLVVLPALTLLARSTPKPVNLPEGPRQSIFNQ